MDYIDGDKQYERCNECDPVGRINPETAHREGGRLCDHTSYNIDCLVCVVRGKEYQCKAYEDKINTYSYTSAGE